MSQINIHNYEAYLLDYSEQQLSAVEVAELLLFVELHPELNIEIEEIQLAYLDQSTEEFKEKDFLKEFPLIETLIIGKTENVLTQNEEQELKDFIIKYPSTEKLVSAYSQTILPVEPIAFPNKGQLKKRQVIPLYWSLAAAACFIGFLITFNLDNSTAIYHSSGEPLAIDKIEFDSYDYQNLSNDAVAVIDTNTKLIPVENNIIQKSNDQLIADKPFIKHNIPSQIKKDSVSIIDVKSLVPIQNIPNNNLAVTDTANKTSLPLEDIALEVPFKSKAPLTVGEYLKVKTKEIVLKEENPTAERLNGNELIASLASGLNEKTKMEVAYDATESEDKKVTKFKLGKIEFYRSSSK